MNRAPALQLADVVAAAAGTTVREIRRGSLCSAVHPDDGVRCTLKGGSPHRKHKTADCRRWEDSPGRVADGT